MFRNELMTSDDYKSVDTVKQALGSIARLGRAAAVHLALACQRASGSTISTDLKNNIQIFLIKYKRGLRTEQSV